MTELPKIRARRLTATLAMAATDAVDDHSSEPDELAGFPADLFLAAPDDILICVVCERVVEDAAECPCGHLFCLTHIQAWLETGNHTCPTCRAAVKPDQLKTGSRLHLAYRRQLGELRLKCPHTPRGCTQVLLMEGFREHTRACEFAPVFCRWKGCPKSKPPSQVNRKDLAGHERSCKFRTVTCTFQGCGRMMPFVDIAEHRKTCANVATCCPVKGCGTSVTRGTLDTHLENADGMAQHMRLLIQHVAELERPDMVDRELVLKIPDITEKLEQQEFNFWSHTHTLRIPGMGNAGYNFQLAIALKPPTADGRPSVLAMFLHIKPGENDALLDWPFPIPYTLAVLDQTRPSPQHISRKIDDPVAQVDGTSYLRPGGGGWGYPQITVLEKLRQRGYTKDGNMFVRITFHTDQCSITI